MKNSAFLFLILISVLGACNKETEMREADYVDPFIGTGGHGHTFPGATVPFGMVQLSPDTRKDNWDGCSGYHYSDSTILGFSHTHLSGTGVGDYGDIRFMPTVGKLLTSVGNAEKKGYSSAFSHKMESAEAGYYAVYLEDYDIYVALTATERAGFHRYRYPKSDSAHIVVDLLESVTSDKILESEINILSDHEISGFRRTDGWANDQYLYFYAEFSKPFESYGVVDDRLQLPGKNTLAGTKIQAFVNFKTKPGEDVFVKVGISAVDAEGAKINVKTEMPDWNFDSIRHSAKEKWQGQLEKIQVKSGTQEQKRAFYTALYHTMVAPNLYSDVDHRYRGHDLQIHRDSSFNMYTVFSLWDTFRTLHPLFTVIERERTVDLINSMLDMYKYDGLLPVWELAANETNCMIGYHAVPVIVDAYRKGIRGFDANMALEAMKASANANQFGLEEYRAKGYIPADKEGEAISRTLEYAYDDWCIAQMAQMLGDSITYREFIERAQYYKNLFDKESGFFRGKSNGCFVQPFDPTQVNFMLTEANTWQYNFFVPQDINTHIDLLGGDEAYSKKLDELFTTNEELTGRVQSDITGLIGQYAHGNEPSHNMAYLYNYAGEPWKTQKIVHQIINELYSDKPDGLSGNEDCGQMSAWYVMSAMGFYPVTPGSNEYVLGTPLFDSLVINLENGNILNIKAVNLNKDNFYVQSVKWNGNEYDKSFITNEMILSGGELVFNMGNTPSQEFGIKPESRPYQKITDNLITPVPYFVATDKTFEKNLEVSLADLDANAEIRWGLATEEDEPALRKFSKPASINKTASFVAVANLNGKNSFFEEATFYKMPEGRSVSIKNPYNEQYTAGGDKALFDMLRGGKDFRSGEWQGYYGVDFEATLDLGKVLLVKTVGAGFNQNIWSWIFMPTEVTFESSTDGKSWKPLGTINNDIDVRASGEITKDFTIAKINSEMRFLKVQAKNIGVCPAWHVGAGDKAWIFVDEIWVK